eukprot:gene10600-12538_t
MAIWLVLFIFASLAIALVAWLFLSTLDTGEGSDACCHALLEGQDTLPTFKEVTTKCTAMQSHPSEGGVLILTHTTASIESYARYSTSLLGAYSKLFGHTLIVEHERPAPLKGREYRYGKVWYLLNWMRHLVAMPQPRPAYIFWLDADAVFVNFETDTLSHVIQEHLQDPETQMAVTREAHGGVTGKTQKPTIVNSGALLLRVGDWAIDFLQAWWNHPEALQGSPDQVTFDALYKADLRGVRRRTVILPIEAMNSGIGTFESPQQQPVIHLFGTPNPVRVQEWNEVLRDTVLDGYLTSLDARAKELRGSPQGFRAMFKFADGLRKNAQLCAPQKAVCVERWGGSAAALEIFKYLDAEIVKQPHQLPERIQILDKIAEEYEHIAEGDNALAIWAEGEALIRAGVSNGPQERLQLAAMLNRQAVALQARSKYEEALGKAKEAMDIWESVMGAENYDMKRFLANIGKILEAAGRSDEAQSYYLRAQNIE